TSTCALFPYTTLFRSLAVRRIHRHAGGVPRLINIIAERALLAGYVHDQQQIGERWVDQAAREALAPRLAKLPKPRLAVVVAMLLGLALLLLWLLPRQPAGSAATTAATAGAAAADAAPADPAPAPAATETVPYLPADDLPARIRVAGPGARPAWGQLLGLWTVRAGEAT